MYGSKLLMVYQVFMKLIVQKDILVSKRAVWSVSPVTLGNKLPSTTCNVQMSRINTRNAG